MRKVAANLSFEQRAARASGLSSLLFDYTVPGIRSAELSIVIAGCLGTVMAFVLAYVLARLLTPQRDPGANTKPGGSSPLASSSS
ncbi:MAG: PDGLE domain-containing protein [Terriglobia bacterium]